MRAAVNPRELVINRSTLLAGTALKHLEDDPDDGMFLHAQTGLSCALGQYLLHLGAPRTLLAQARVVGELGDLLPADAEWLVERGDSPWADGTAATSALGLAIQNANDDDKAHATRREAKLKRLFGEAYVDVTFVGNYADATKVARTASQMN